MTRRGKRRGRGKGHGGRKSETRAITVEGVMERERAPLVPPEVRARREAVAGPAWMSDAAGRPLVALAAGERITPAERRAGEELAALHIAYRRAIGGPLAVGRPGDGAGHDGSESRDAGVIARMEAVEGALALCPAPALARAVVWSVVVEEDWPMDPARWALATPMAWRALSDGLAAVGDALGVPTRSAA